MNRDCHDPSDGPARTIRFSVARTSLGLVLIASTDRGLCAVLRGDTRAELIADLEAHYGGAQLVEQEGPWVSNVLNALSGHATIPRHGWIGRRRRLARID